MNSVFYQHIIETLGSQNLTVDQLYGKLRTSWSAPTKIPTMTRVRSALRDMAANGTVVIDRTMEATGVIKRFSVALDMYRADQIDGARWGVIRFDVSGLHPVTIGNAMTEAEARVCATALNAHDRKVRGFKS